MKKITLLLIILLFSIVGFSQQVRLVGNKYVTISDTSSKSRSIGSKAKLTGNTYKDLPVYQSANGKLFIKKVSKTSGKEYNYYLKVTE